MSSQESNETLRFTQCANLNTEHCLYSKHPETILSLFSDPVNFAIDDGKVQELNKLCDDCQRFKK
jgi:hypothetical protein